MTNSSLWALLSVALELSWFPSPPPVHPSLPWLSLWDFCYFQDFQAIHTEAPCDWSNLIAIHVPVCLAQSCNQDGLFFSLFAGFLGLSSYFFPPDLMLSKRSLKYFFSSLMKLESWFGVVVRGTGTESGRRWILVPPKGQDQLGDFGPVPAPSQGRRQGPTHLWIGCHKTTIQAQVKFILTWYEVWRTFFFNVVRHPASPSCEMCAKKPNTFFLIV